MELNAFDSECNFTYTVRNTALPQTVHAVQCLLAMTEEDGWIGLSVTSERCLMARFDRVGDE